MADKVELIRMRLVVWFEENYWVMADRFAPIKEKEGEIGCIIWVELLFMWCKIYVYIYIMCCVRVWIGRERMAKSTMVGRARERENERVRSRKRKPPRLRDWVREREMTDRPWLAETMKAKRIWCKAMARWRQQGEFSAMAGEVRGGHAASGGYGRKLQAAMATDVHSASE